MKSVEAAERWKERQCKRSKRRRAYRTAVKNAKAKGDELECTIHGGCVRDMCKYCFTWELVSEIMKETEAMSIDEEEHQEEKKVSKERAELKTTILAKLRQAWKSLSILDD